MNSQRITDGSPGFFGVLGLIGVAMLAAAMWLLTEFPPNEFELKQPKDACIGGIVQSSDGKNWHPVYIKKTKRTIPCSEVAK